MHAFTSRNRDAGHAYVARWFISFDELTAQVGGDRDRTRAFIDAGCAPGVVYAETPDGWWSALGAYVGRESSAPPKGAAFWFSPAAAWWLRRAALLQEVHGGSPGDCAARLEQDFIDAFLAVLPAEDGARLAYASCFDDAGVSVEAARRTAAEEWRAWTSGAYAVCLRRFSAASCVRKESLRALIVASGEAATTPEERLALFDRVEELESLLLPFAPWERDNGTPGKAVDAPLATLGLGREAPYRSLTPA